MVAVWKPQILAGVQVILQVGPVILKVKVQVGLHYCL
jgi:hypothetical protein